MCSGISRSRGRGQVPLDALCPGLRADMGHLGVGTERCEETGGLRVLNRVRLGLDIGYRCGPVCGRGELRSWGGGWVSGGMEHGCYLASRVRW